MVLPHKLPGVWLLAFAVRMACGAEEPASPAKNPERSAAPLSPPGDVIALAATNRDRWQQPKGNWEFKSDHVIGSGDSRIDFNGPFQPPFTLEFRLRVIEGMRPRVYVGPLTFANRGYEHTLAVYPNNADGVPVAYELNRDYAVSIAIERESAVLTVDGRKVMTATIPNEEIRAITFSGGDWWSKGSTRFSDIIIRPTTTAKPVTSAPVVQPEVQSPLKDEFERDLASASEERKAAKARLVAEYSGVLDALVRKLNEEGRSVIAAAARAEKARVDSGIEITEEQTTRAPFEVLNVRAAHLEKVRALVREYEAKVGERTTRYLGALENAAASAEEKELPAARELFERESVRLKGAIKPAVQRVTKRTSAAGGDGGGPFQEVVENDGLLTGLVLHTGDFAGHAVFVAVQPIFRIAGAARLGTMRGVPSGAAVKLEAAEGYAIGGLNLHSGDRVDGLEIVFMKIKPGGLALDPADSYTSKWVGGKGGGPVKISGRGNAIVGIYGASGLEFDSLGLIELVQSNTPGASVKEVIRENPATIAVTSLTAETLAESPTREAGKWQHVPEALRGAKIFSTGPKHLGVAEYKVSGPGRVYVACNYNYQGNPSGNWTEERWMAEDFQKNGWALVEGVELRSWEGRTFQIFTRELKSGESGRLRCNKYEPPYFISFIP